MRLFGWKLIRARYGMTAAGVDDDGVAAEVAVVSVEPRGRSVFAIDRKGEEYELVVGGQTN